MPGIFSLLILQCHISKLYIWKSKRRSEILSYLKSKVFKGLLGLASQQQQCPSKTNLCRGLLLSLSVEEDQTRNDLKYRNLYKVLGWWEWLSKDGLFYTHEVSSLSESFWICLFFTFWPLLSCHMVILLLSFFVVLSLGNHYTLYIYECMWKKPILTLCLYLISFLKNPFSKKKWVILAA